MTRTVFKWGIVWVMAGVLAGCGDSPTISILPKKATFKQSANEFNNKLDILFVVDNSNSMEQEQNNLASNFSSFISTFQSKGYDFKISVTSTDAYFADNSGNWFPSAYYNAVNAPLGSLRDRAIYSYGGSYAALPKPDAPFAVSECRTYNPPVASTNIFLPTTANLSTHFARAVKQYVCGYGDERAFSSTLTVLDKNPTWLRSDSFLAIIVVSDEDDFSSKTRAPGAGGQYSSALPISTITAALDSKTNYTSGLRRYSVSTIGYQNTSPHCTVPSAITSNWPTRYKQMTDATDGVFGDICDPSFASSLDAIQNKIAELSTRFVLESTPDMTQPFTVSISYGCDDVYVTVPQNSSNGWSYDSGTNAISFHGSYIPPQNSCIGVDYTPTGASF